LALFPADRQLLNFAAGFGVQVRLKEMELRRPRQWGACWLACHLYEQLGLDEFWAECLVDSREGTCWQHILQTLVCYRLIDPGSEWRLHWQWFEQSAIGDLLDEDFSLVEKNALYRCLDKVLKHTSDKTTLGEFLRKIEEQYGKADRVWLMDRGIPTEEVLAEMRSSDPPIYYLVGTPKGRLSKLEADLLERPWQSVRPGVEVKVLPQENELYVFAQSRDRLNKERAMRRRQLKALWKRLGQLQQMKLSARNLLLKLGEAKGRYRAAGRFWREIPVPTGISENQQVFRRCRFCLHSRVTCLTSAFSLRMRRTSPHDHDTSRHFQCRNSNSFISG
jgi:hypothetical protein